MHVGEPANYKVERWDWKDSHVEEIVASAGLIMIGHAAFHAAVEQYPRSLGHNVRLISPPEMIDARTVPARRPEFVGHR